MLKELHISNFALIDQQTLSFGAGLNVISGESGAGKSIILHALELILGSKIKPHMLRAGQDELEVQALFDLSQLSRTALAALPDVAQTEELAISRTLNAAGRGKLYINGRLGSIALLEDISSRLVNICGQNQHVRLLSSLYHLELVDNYAGLTERVERYRQVYSDWRDLERQLEQAKQNNSQVDRRRGELEQVLQELEALKPEAGMREELEGQVKRLAGAEEIVAGSQTILSGLNDERGLISHTLALLKKLSDLAAIDAKLKPLESLMQSANMELVEIERELNRYVSSIEISEAELEDLRDKLAEVARIERKYRTDCAGLVQLLIRARLELEGMQTDNFLRDLQAKAASAFEQMLLLAAELKQARAEAAKALVEEVNLELKTLNMEGSRLQVQIEDEEFGPRGRDRLEILMASNGATSLKPLKLIASGGELSRITLVMKKVLRDRSGVNVLVFDEVDSGVSGGVARAIGEKLRALARDSQVICITHLPQIASLADKHFLVTKQHFGSKQALKTSAKGNGAVSLGQSVTLVREILEDARVEEIARMLAGYEVTEASRESARELLSSK